MTDTPGKKLFYHIDLEKLGERVTSAEKARDEAKAWAEKARELATKVGVKEGVSDEDREAAEEAATNADKWAEEAQKALDEAQKLMAELTRGSDWKGAFAALLEAVRDHERETFPRGRPFTARVPGEDPHRDLYDVADELVKPFKDELPNGLE